MEFQLYIVSGPCAELHYLYVLMNGVHLHSQYFQKSLLICSYELPPNERVMCLKYTDRFAIEPNGPKVPLLLVCVCVTSGQLDVEICGGKLYVFKIDLAPHEKTVPL